MSERKLTMVVNPHGGVKQARQILEQVRPIFEAAGVSLEVHETEYRNHAEELARELDLSGAYGLCAIGGDGTFHEVINGMMVRPESERLPIGILAAGSGNTFLDTCDLLAPLAAAEGMAQGRTRPIDLARVELSDQVRYACNIVGWGLVILFLLFLFLLFMLCVFSGLGLGLGILGRVPGFLVGRAFIDRVWP